MSTTDSMTFLEHLGALRKHLMRASLAIIVAAGVAFAFRGILFDEILLAPKSRVLSPTSGCACSEISWAMRPCV